MTAGNTKRTGRPRSIEVDGAIIEATTQQLIEGGFGRLTVDAVAARAGVGKATIYRRWPSKTELLRATLASFNDVVSDDVATGDLRRDLQTLLRRMVEEFVDSDAARLMPQLAAEAQFDPQLRELLHTNARIRREVFGHVLERARARGELRDDLDLEVVIDLLIAPVFVRKLITGTPITTSITDNAVDAVLSGIVRGSTD